MIDYSLQYTEPEKFRAEKGRLISSALEKIKNNGYVCKLLNYDNAHIQAISKSGKKMSYYACSDTITGYAGTDVQGIDWLIKLLNEN